MPEIFSSYLHNAKNDFPIQALRNIVYAILPDQDVAGQDKPGPEKKDRATRIAGSQRLVTICGKSGSGKTMLLSAMAAYLDQGCNVLHQKAASWLAGQEMRHSEQPGQNGQNINVLLLDDLQGILQGIELAGHDGNKLARDTGQNGQGKGVKKSGLQDDARKLAADLATSRLCDVLDSLAAMAGVNGERSAEKPDQDARQGTGPKLPELVILAFCGPATGLASLGQRLQTRLCQGLVLELHEPDLDVRLKYAENFAKKQKIALERGQLVHIARYCSNIPAVAGVMTRIGAYLEAGFSFTDQAGLEKLVQNGGQPVMPGCRDIVHEVARLTDTRPAEIIGRSRKAEVVLARQLSLLVCRRMLGLSYMELGREFGGRDHSTVMHAIEKFHRAAVSDKRMNNLVTEVENSLKLRTENLAGRFSMFVA